MMLSSALIGCSTDLYAGAVVYSEIQACKIIIVNTKVVWCIYFTSDYLEDYNILNDKQ